MPRLNRLHSILDRFEERLEVDCEQLKRQLVAQVDQQFGGLRTKVAELRGRFAGGSNRNAVPSVHFDDSHVETVSMDEWMQERRASEESHNAPSTSSGHKRKSTIGQSQSTNKRQKSGGSSAGRYNFVCKYSGCGKSFPSNAKLASHERIHLGVKPFLCTWDNCSYSSEQRGPVITHIRLIHFKLPQTVKQQNRLNMVDDRNPGDFIRVDTHALARRL